MELHVRYEGDDDPEKCTARRLARFDEVTLHDSARATPRGIVLDPHAERLAAGLDDLDGLDAHNPETNIVLVDTDRPAEAFLADCESAGVLGVPFADRQVRFCTHLDVERAGVERAVERIAEVA